VAQQVNTLKGRNYARQIFRRSRDAVAIGRSAQVHPGENRVVGVRGVAGRVNVRFLSRYEGYAFYLMVSLIRRFDRRHDRQESLDLFPPHIAFRGREIVRGNRQELSASQRKQDRQQAYRN
jgi:hypothetical protein